MIKPIVAYGNDILVQETEDLKIGPDESLLLQIIEDLKDTVRSIDHAAGLAANQIGYPYSVFATRNYTSKEDDRDDIRIFINPEIVYQSPNHNTCDDGCLSIPGINLTTIRPMTVEMKYIDEAGKDRREILNHFQSQVCQHEYDHLKGILFIDRVKKKKLKPYLDVLENIKAGNVNVNYEMKF